jgi:hypothetical protein
MRPLKTSTRPNRDYVGKKKWLLLLRTPAGLHDYSRYVRRQDSMESWTPGVLSACIKNEYVHMMKEYQSNSILGVVWAKTWKTFAARRAADIISDLLLFYHV